MAINIVDVGGVNLNSHPILQRDCAFPVTNLSTHCPPDQVFQNMPVVYGGWEDGVTAPAIIGTGYTIHTTDPCPPSEPCLDACRSPIVNMNLDVCELLAPSMKCIFLGTPIMDWRTVISRFCRQRNILAAGVNIFDRNGLLDYSQRSTLDFVKFSLQAVWDTLGQLIVYNATAGDASQQNQWDGLYTQLRGGWEPATANPCPDQFNREQSINWADLTGKTAGQLASPDDCTMANKTVTIWGKTFNVPAGLNLAEFVDDLWIPKIEAEGACKGEVNAFEMHVGWGQAKCFINTVACMKACNACEEDPDQRMRLMDFNKKMMVELFPSGTRLPILQSRYIEANTIRIGPRLINNEPTYALFIEDMDKWLSMLPTGSPQGPFDKFRFRGEPDYSFLCDTDWAKQIESRGIYWNLRPVEDKCIKGVSQMCGGVLATARHLWLRIENVTCGSFVESCDLPVTYN
jgi:hypothetical protein